MPALRGPSPRVRRVFRSLPRLVPAVPPDCDNWPPCPAGPSWTWPRAGAQVASGRRPTLAPLRPLSHCTSGCKRHARPASASDLLISRTERLFTSLSLTDTARPPAGSSGAPPAARNRLVRAASSHRRLVRPCPCAVVQWELSQAPAIFGPPALALGLIIHIEFSALSVTSGPGGAVCRMCRIVPHGAVLPASKRRLRVSPSRPAAGAISAISARYLICFQLAHMAMAPETRRDSD